MNIEIIAKKNILLYNIYSKPLKNIYNILSNFEKKGIVYTINIIRDNKNINNIYSIDIVYIKNNNFYLKSVKNEI